MADFKTKLLTLAGAAVMFAGMANAQYTVSGVTTTAGDIRIEGTTELLPTQTVVLNNTGGGSNGGNITLTLTEPAAVTSENTGGSSPVYEITATVTGTGNVPGSTGTITVSGNTVTIPVTLPSTANVTVAISNIRINASTMVSGAVSEGVQISGTAAFAGTIPNPAVATVINGLGAYSIKSATANQICATLQTTAQFNVSIPEGFPGAFKTKAGEASGIGTDTATAGTRLAITLANVPSNISTYFPLQVTATGATGAGNAEGVLTLITSASATGTGASVPVAAVGGSGPFAAYGLVTGGVAYYELTTPEVSTTVETYSVPVYFGASGSLAASSAVTAAVSFAPTNPISTNTSYPNFVVGASTGSPQSASSFVNCTTTLLFPFVANGNGLDTGIAIANTSIDTLGAKGASSVTAQAGTCSLTFFPTTQTITSGAVSAVAAGTPIAYTTVSVPTGGVWSSGMVGAGASGVVGYMIASCNFFYAHGFAYLSYELGGPNGATMGYTADVLPASRPVSATTPESAGQ